MKTANWFWRFVLRRVGSAAVTMAWGAIYCLPGRENDAQLLAHESAHIEQIKRDGAVLWMLRVVYYFLRYGYQNSPYEVEARAKSGN